MKLLIFVLKKTEKLDSILTEFAHRDICGATIIDGVGMATLLYSKHDEDEIPFLGMLRSLATPEREKCKVILAAINDDQLDDAVKVIEEVVGDLSNENTGVIFSVPLDFTKGICRIGK
jgi:hypothetical protein